MLVFQQVHLGSFSPVQFFFSFYPHLLLDISVPPRPYVVLFRLRFSLQSGPFFLQHTKFDFLQKFFLISSVRPSQAYLSSLAESFLLPPPFLIGLYVQSWLGELCFVPPLHPPRIIFFASVTNAVGVYSRYISHTRARIATKVPSQNSIASDILPLLFVSKIPYGAATLF